MPADFGDEAQAIQDAFLEQSLKVHRPIDIPFSGVCLSCGDPVKERRFCDSTCRESYEHSQKTARIRGL